MISTQSRLQYASGYLDLGMLKEAAEELDAIAEPDRKSVEVMSLRVRLYLESRNWELMEAVARFLVDRHPEHAHCWVHWAYALRELQMVREAYNVARRALRYHPREAILHFNLACYCSLLGDTEEAGRALEKAIEIEPSFREEAKADPDLENLRRIGEPNN